MRMLTLSERARAHPLLIAIMIGRMEKCDRCGDPFRTSRPPELAFICGPCTPPDCGKPQSRVTT